MDDFYSRYDGKCSSRSRDSNLIDAMLDRLFRFQPTAFPQNPFTHTIDLKAAPGLCAARGNAKAK
jgi:hypothetical protein